MKMPSWGHCAALVVSVRGHILCLVRCAALARSRSAWTRVPDLHSASCTWPQVGPVAHHLLLCSLLGTTPHTPRLARRAQLGELLP
ncbi:hypothetical protein PF008_g24963 [Phytophthora fragariae]|uniref:Secreted protein n=1 Tax=Phytophthora fragariae TaxID=53985 RepID=A0A6G0QLI2_9STRA|nr:hypothetical protein PF008_g24963 [Phytophthora fragariae]